MKLFNRLFRRRPAAANRTARRALAGIQAEYDAAATTRHNALHWQNATSADPNSTASPTVRAELRKRSRYELLESNSYGTGIVRTLATDLVGLGGPRLVMSGPSPAGNDAIELAFNSWAVAVKLSQKITTMRQAKCVDGESLAVKVNNPRLFPVQLDFRIIEADYLASPTGENETATQVDGVQLDEIAEPVKYHLFDEHPGGLSYYAAADTGRWYDSDDVVHWYREDRPGQRRGVPEMVGALPLFAQLRRYTLAVTASAETAANFAAIIYSDSPAFDPDDVDDSFEVDIEPRTITSMPFGWKVAQLKPEQPTTQYQQFVRQIMTEICRCVSMPLNKALGDSSGSSFSSGRLDHHVYHAAIDSERISCNATVLHPLLRWWYDEAAVVPGVIPAELGPSYLDHARWVWPAYAQIDELKSATAVATLYDRGLMTDEQYWLSRGLDPDAQYSAIQRQNQRRRELNDQAEVDREAIRQ